MQVRFENVSKDFESRHGKVRAVDKLSLNIGSGILFGFLGPSGCGKSTSLFMLSGVYPLSEGRLYFDDKDVSDVPPEEREIGMVFQNYALYPHLTVKENIEFPLVNSKLLKRKLKGEAKRLGVAFKDLVEKKVEDAAAIVEISKYMDRRPSELSGGQQQRVAIARAIVKEPSLLLLDEPLSNLDARLRLQTREEIRKIQQRTGITTVFVTHDQEEAMNICDEIAIMKDGVLQQTGKPEFIYDNPDNLFVAKFLGAFPINILSGRIVGKRLFLGGMCIHDGILLDDGEYTVGIRPENMVVSDSGVLDVAVSGKVRSGGMTMVDAVVGGTEHLHFILPPGNSVDSGSKCSLSIRPGTICIFGENGRKVMQC